MAGILVLAVSPSVSAEDCAAGERHYREARQAVEPSAKIEWLRRSLEACPTFEAWYLLGGAYRETGKTEQARQAFQSAYGLASNEDARALALARSAQALADLDRVAEAIQELRAAIARHSNPPAWMMETLRDLDLAQAQRVVSAEQITRALTTRSFGVVPRIDLRVHFAFDSAALAEEGDAQLQELGKALAASALQGHTFRIIGHTDKQGDADYNQQLSQRRANTVVRELTQRFPSLAGRLQSEGHGERELLYAGDSEEDHRLNRRVEVRVE
jgi:outer membrane protein OmpA-like peptidoglycan-associated protein